MKTILIIENTDDVLETTTAACSSGRVRYTILSAGTPVQARTILAADRVDLIICSTVFPDTAEGALINELSNTFPFIPLIAIRKQQDGSSGNIMLPGAHVVLEHPVAAGKLLEHVDDLAERSSTGVVKGIPVSSFLQMLENDGESCTLCVSCGSITGSLFLREGTLVAAETGSLSGEEAVYEMISWEGVHIEIRFFNGCKDDKITKPLISLIMEGLRLKDEKEEQRRQQQALAKPDHNLKQISTAGHRLALEIGLRLRMEFESSDSNLDSALVGLVPDKCVITTTPGHFLITRDKMALGDIALIKFTYTGKLCMFKSKLIKTVETPLQLLFFEYPDIIYYHEMRKEKRTSIYIPCTLDLDGRQSYSGTVLDINSTGTLCQLKARRNESLPDVKIKQAIELRCILPGLTDQQRIRGVIRNLKTNSQEIRMGIEFSELDSQVKETIKHYLVEQ
ncbi:MAG: DUF4388 domain-containing protein [Desulfocapsaceae bacterium]|jgi:c-di-GMP-binding flagellar brake protein YcgR|nr:DUF4388 domain-containing protein [Desulfocapsaceae bacterium]